VRSILELVAFWNFETLVERILVETQKLRISMKGKKCKSKESQFSSIVKLSDDKSNVEECNMFLEDYDEYNAIKRLI